MNTVEQAPATVVAELAMMASMTKRLISYMRPDLDVIPSCLCAYSCVCIDVFFHMYNDTCIYCKYFQIFNISNFKSLNIL